MDKVKVAVYPSGTEIGLEIGRQLRYSKSIELIGLNSCLDFSRFIYSKNFTDFVDVYHPELELKLIKFTKENEINILVPAHDEAIFRLSHFDELKNNVKILTPSSEIAEILRYKSKTYSALKDIISTPKVFSNTINPLSFPIFAKPDRGQGSVGAMILKSKSDLDHLLASNFQSYILTEFLPGNEYTVDCFSSNDHRVLFCNGRIRDRVSKGISVRSFSVFDNRFFDFANKISDRLGMIGPWFFQVKKDDQGNLKLLEVASRIGGTSGQSRSLGFNIMEAAIYQLLGYPIKVVRNHYSVTIERALESAYEIDLTVKFIYVDLDDTIILEGHLVGRLIGFLFEAKSRGCEVILITRHKGNLQDTLTRFGLTYLFSEIIHIKDNSPKSRFIKHFNRSVFIDDSFAERLEVSETSKIPVFSIDMIDMLVHCKFDNV